MPTRPNQPVMSDTQSQLPPNVHAQQQHLMSKLNETLDSMKCDATCRQKKQEGQLHQTYMDSVQQQLSAKQTAHDAQKAYVTHKHGETQYTQMVIKDIQKKGYDIIRKLTHLFKEEIELTDDLIDAYGSLEKGVKHMPELDDMLSHQNANMMQEHDKYTNTIETSERTAYYTQQNTANMQNWYKWMYRVFYVLVLISASYVVLFEPTNVRFVAITAVLALYPFAIDWLVLRIARIFKFMWNNTYVVLFE